MLGPSTLLLDELSVTPSEFKFTSLSSVVFLVSDSSVIFGEVVVVFSTVRFFLGTSTHSDISITASARSNEKIPLLLREKCRFALMGEDKFRDEYLDNTRKTQKINVMLEVCVKKLLENLLALKHYIHLHMIQRIAILTSRLHLSGQIQHTAQI